MRWLILFAGREWCSLNCPLLKPNTSHTMFLCNYFYTGWLNRQPVDFRVPFVRIPFRSETGRPPLVAKIQAKKNFKPGFWALRKQFSTRST